MYGARWTYDGASRCRSSFKLAAATALGAMVLPAGVGAQDAVDPELADVISLDAITVTARGIEEPVQQVPFGISVFNAPRIERERVRDARSFARNTPGFNFFDSGVRGSNIPNIRGVGSFFPLSPDDTSVPVFIDGVSIPVRSQDRELFDVERIEVLRGPQNTIFGRNAQAGAISITTADPTFTPEFEIGAEIGNFSARRIQAIASGPFSSTLAGRISGQFDTRNGDFDDINLNDDVRDQQVVNANGKLLWLPGESTDASLAVRYGNYDEQSTEGVLLDDPGFPRASLDTPFSYDLETIGSGLTVTHDFGALTLTSITGIQYYTSAFSSDNTDGLIFSVIRGVPPAALNDPDNETRNVDEENLQLSQEFQLEGELENGTRWLAGFNFFRSIFEVDTRFNVENFVVGDFAEEIDTTSYSAFAEVTVPVTERLRAIAGLRFTHEVKDFENSFSGFIFTGIPSETSQDDSRSFNLVTGRAALSYDFLPALTGFASVSRGAKTGGFQLLDLDSAFGFETTEFDTATTWSTEAGVRGTLLDGRLDLSASAFFNDTTDEQVQVFDVESLQFVLENLDVQTYGIELESTARPVDGLSLSTGVGFVQTEITASDDPAIAVGNEVPFAPSITFNVAGQYDYPFDILGHEGGLFGRAEYQFVGSRTVDPANSLTLESYDLVNLRVGWDSDRVSVYGFVDNLLDETYAESAFSFGTSPAGDAVHAAIPSQPRRFGVGVRLRF